MIQIEKLREIAKYAIDLGFNVSIVDDGTWATFERHNISVKYSDPLIKFSWIEKIQIHVEQINLVLADLDSFMIDMENAKQIAEMLYKEVAEK